MGLANRVAWTEALDQERPRRSRYRRPVVVMSVDVDGLKQANDRFGHDAGDELLRGVAAILRRNLRDADVVARIGGDEFGVLLPETQPDAMPAGAGGAHSDRLAPPGAARSQTCTCPSQSAGPPQSRSAICAKRCGPPTTACTLPSGAPDLRLPCRECHTTTAP